MNSELKSIQKLSLVADLWQIGGVMKTLYAYLVLTGAALLCSSCAYNQHGVVLNSVGPSPYVSGTSTTGTLMVFSAFSVTSPGIGDFEHRQHYSDYKILSDDGKPLQTVHNDVGTVTKEATRVQLAPGKYRVSANSNGFGTVTVPVIIAANQTTILHLEGGYLWPKDAAPDLSNSVRLPDGEIVGWRATE
jgi:hypothetical protein